MKTEIDNSTPEKIYYKGKGNHSVNQLETIIEQQAEELHQLKSRNKETDNKKEKVMKIEIDIPTIGFIKWITKHTESVSGNVRKYKGKIYFMDSATVEGKDGGIKDLWDEYVKYFFGIE